MKLTFHGATDEVTGSCMLLEVADSNGKPHRIVVDAGMIQGERLCGTKNLVPFGFDPRTVEAVFVTHPHADHTGRLPKLIRDGYAGKITMTRPGLALTRIVLEDAFHIMSENAEKCGDPLVYSEEDLDLLISRSEGVGYHQAITVAPGVTVTFHDAGHVLGSAYISVDAEGKRLVFSGDIGNDHVPILPPTEPISHADFVVCESTYGDRLHEGRAERVQKLREILERTVARGGVLMIPSFSIERTQELLYELDQILLHEMRLNAPIFLDSPMAIRATEIYRNFSEYLQFDADILKEADRDFFSFPNLRETLNVDASKQINDVKGAKVIIAGSGMMTGGRIMHHLMRYLPDPNNALLIIGYQAGGTLGRKLFDKEKEVVIFGKPVQVRCQVEAIGSFSAHGDRDKLTRWLKPEEGPVPKKVLLSHGDPDAKIKFAEHLRGALKTEVVIPKAGDVYEL